MATVTRDLEAAHDTLVPLLQAIPDAALDWSPGGESWSLKQIIGHLAHANDFYVMIIEEARATGWGRVELRPELAGWQQMLATDAEVAHCATTEAACACFERAYGRLRDVLEGLAPEELDRPFVFRRPHDPPITTTIRRRVIETAAEHMREHQPPLSETLAGWAASRRGAR